MENNNQYDDLLVRYLFNEETEEEKIFVENWLNVNEENKHYFDRLKKAWQLTGIKQDLVYITEEANLREQWNRLEQKITKEQPQIIPVTELETSGDEYGEDEKPASKPMVYRLLVSIAVAASVLLVVGLGWKLFVGNKVETPVVQNPGPKSGRIHFVVRNEVNTTGKEKRVLLSDGSLIVLADKSEITYREPFGSSRDVTLIGKAYFKVARDKTSPFTVTSGAIATTALGTEFTVTAFKEQKRIIVRLYEGKVVVKPVDKVNSRFKNDVFLLPGQEFVYSSQASGQKQSFKWHEAAAPEKILSEELYLDNPAIPESVEESWFMFNNQTLGQVLNELAGIYDVQIIYDQKDVENIYLTGKYRRSDSLQFILEQIGILHDLKITKKDSAFIISK